MKVLSRALYVFATAGSLALTVSASEIGSTAKVTISSGPHAGSYALESMDACTLAAFGGESVSFAVVLMASRASLSIDIPNIDPKRLEELQIELVIADPNGDASRKRTASTRYVVDTRPDASLAPYQREERGNGGMSGRGRAKLQDLGATARLEFSGTTAAGVRFDGTVECRRLDRENGR